MRTDGPSCTHSARPASTIAHHLGGWLSVFTYETIFGDGSRTTVPVGTGLRVVVYLRGQTDLQVADLPAIRIAAPALLVGFADRALDREQTFPAGQPLSSVHVRIDLNHANAVLGDSAASVTQRWAERGFAFEGRPADATVQAVASQILAAAGPAGQPLYQAAKALELIALVFEAEALADPAASTRRLTVADRRQVDAARALILERLDAAPDLDAIARRVGTSPAKLNRAFRIAYGMTLFAFLQEQRLQAAYRMLAGCEVGVGTVALSVGYTAPHFATLFKKRFGLRPSSLGMSRAKSLL
ncbi:AraC family transcriptional regulator [Methylobacterium sp. NEAU 140]|uniref:helix-turn-helix domain-containing protein n=1 Tax=Methylobacterium sp. NEAU 140 TaxID=3064945 RepID=UPI002734B341|nr:AraC family transcriptional regulator [Methylobacterium sp. NEAU 140]MDP4027130.1 AraC family transcriptional regulator [Methylobacterium sp. NEAU 140]